MIELIELHELSRMEELANDPTAIYAPQARLLLLIQGGLSVRQAAARTGFSPSGVQYWVKRFRRLRLNAFKVKNEGSRRLLLSETQDTGGQTTDSSILELVEDVHKYQSSTSSGVERKWIFTDLSLPEKLDKPGIQVDDTLAAAGKKTLLFNFLQMLKNEEGTILGENIETLHDMRVATRRMRAAFEVFGDEYSKKFIKPILKGLRYTGRSLGRVRDLDVFMEKANRYLSFLPSEKKTGLDPLFQIWQDQRSRLREKMVSHLQSPQHERFLTEFAQFVTVENAGLADKNDDKKATQNLTRTGRVRSTVPLLVYTRLASVNAYENVLPSANMTQLHALRIELKQFRYTLEFFSEVLDPDVNFVIKEIKELQDHLGDLNDANVACKILGDILNNWENLHSTSPLVDRPNPEPIVAYLAYRADERHQLLVSFPAAWENFNRLELRRKLALSIAVL